MSATTIFRFLEGSWNFSRTITGGSGSTMAKCEGLARFSLQGNDKLNYFETGTMETGNQASMNFHKSYCYSLNHGSMSIYFDSDCKTLYQNIKFDDLGNASGAHLCNKDTYTTEYCFNQQKNSFSTKCSVSGPKKDYIIHSIYRRAIPEQSP